MSLTLAEKALWKADNQRIEYGLLPFHGSWPNDLSIIGMNYVEDMHHQTKGQLDLRLAGEVVVTGPIQSVFVAVRYIDAGGDEKDAGTLGLFFVRNRVYDEAADSTVFRLFTIDGYLVDRQFQLDDLYTGAAISITDWAKTLAEAALPGYYGQAVNIINTAGVTGNVLAEQQRGLLGTAMMTNIDNILRAKNARLVANGPNLEILDIDPLTWEYGLPDEVLQDGPRKILKNATVEDDRERWYNAVTLRYWYSNASGTTESLYYARVYPGSSDNAPDKTGYKIYTEEINGGISGVAGLDAARNTLKALLKRRSLLKANMALTPHLKVGHAVKWKGEDYLISKIQMDLVSDTLNFEAELAESPEFVLNYTPTI